MKTLLFISKEVDDAAALSLRGASKLPTPSTSLKEINHGHRGSYEDPPTSHEVLAVRGRLGLVLQRTWHYFYNLTGNEKFTTPNTKSQPATPM